MFDSREKTTNSFRSPTNTSIQKRQVSGAGIEYMDNRRSAVAQMDVKKNPVQRKLTMKGSFDGAVFDGDTDDDTLNGFADELLDDDPEYAENNISREQIVAVLRNLADNGDHTLYDWELKDHIIPKDLSDGLGSDEEQFDESDELSESPVSDDIVIGKRVFDRNVWHHTVKKSIIAFIGIKTLSNLVYGDKSHHNFDFWIGKDGRIWAGGNNTGGHEVATDYRLTLDNKVEEV